MPILDNQTWRSIHNSMQVKIHQLAYANFQWTGRNTYACNRCFMVLEGQGTVTNQTDGRHHLLKQGTALFMPPFLDLSFTFQQNLKFICCHFNVELLPGVDVFRNQRTCTEWTLNTDKLQDLIPLITAEPDWQDWCHLEAFIWDFFQHLPFPDNQKISDYLKLAGRYSPLLQHIRENLSAQLDIGGLADFCGVSRGTLSRNFSRDFDLPLKTFIQQELIALAARYLTFSTLSIKDIARKLEFSSEYYFSNFFHRITGTSPSAFRQNTGLYHGTFSGTLQS